MGTPAPRPPAPDAGDEAPSSAVEDVIGIVVAVTAIATVALMLLGPWMPRYEPGGGRLNRYAPLRDGSATLLAQYDGAGKLIAWQSQNTAILAPARALSGELRDAALKALQAHTLKDGGDSSSTASVLARFENLRIAETSVNTLGADGALKETGAVSVRDASGDFVLSISTSAGETSDIVFTPALINLPADLRAGSAWQREGALSSEISYTQQGRVVMAGPFENSAGKFDDCIQVESRLVFANRQQVLSDQTARSWYCAGTGLVEEQDFDASGKLTGRLVLASANGRAADPLLLPATQVTSPVTVTQAPLGATAGFDAWRMSRVGRVGKGTATTGSTIPPVWIPARPAINSPALVLAGGYNADLTAFDASDPSGKVLWRFHTEGTVYSPPGYDARGRIFFGATDKHLYALDTRGLFLWSFEAGDNIATRPLIVSDTTVVFGSEDRNIYGLDAASGQLRWKVKTGGAVVSAPACFHLDAGNTVPEGGEQCLVVIGSDDGGVYALDPLHGEQRWLFTAGDAVEAPIIATADAIYAASRDRNLYALNPLNGEPVWSAEADYVLRTAPAVGERAVYQVDDYGGLYAFDRAGGKRLWATVEQIYLGPPMLVDQTLLVATKDGRVRRIGLDGNPQGEWPATGAALPSDGAPALKLGLGIGPAEEEEPSVWFADESAVVRRLGPATGGASALAVLWSKANTDPVFGNFFYAPPAAYGDNAAVVMPDKSIHLINAATGDARHFDPFTTQPGTPFVEPAIHGDTLIIPISSTLYAVYLQDGRMRWRLDGTGNTYRPVTIAGDTALWLVHAPRPGDSQNGSATATGSLYAVDVSSGDIRWQHPISGFQAAGGAVVDMARNIVYISTPPSAYDLASGQRLWQSEVDGQGTGGPALSVNGDTLYIGLYQPDADSGAVAAIDTATGRARWQVKLNKALLMALDRLWAVDGRVIVPSINNKIIALDAANGALQWEYTPAHPRFAGILATADAGGRSRIWLALQNGEILMLETATGKVVARLSDITLSLSSYSLAQHPVRAGDAVVVPLGTRLLAIKVPDE